MDCHQLNRGSELEPCYGAEAQYSALADWRQQYLMQISVHPEVRCVDIEPHKRYVA